ncbi:MAG: TMEM175 family protein [Nakamurella sp.]
MNLDGPAQPGATVGFRMGRVEAFSDGVIAVAITLLVLDLRVPAPSDTVMGSGLARRLGEMWPNYLAYVISFLAIGIIWISHHAALQRLKMVDQAVLATNLVLLMCIAVLPFTTSLFATYLNAPDGGHIAAVVYAGSFFVTSAAFFTLQFLIVARRPGLLRESLTARESRRIVGRGLFALPTYLIAALLGLASPYLTLAVCVAAGAFYLVPTRAREFTR